MDVTTANSEGESRCLSTLKSASDVYSAAAMGLEAKHFTERKHQLIYAAVTRAVADTGTTDLQAVWAQLLSLGGNSPVELRELVDIDALEPTSLNRNRYVDLVIACARKRALTVSLATALREAKSDADDWSDVWSRVSPHIQAAQETFATNQIRSVAEMCATVREEIEKPETAKLLSTGLATWDRSASLIHSWEVIALGGRPATGKTALALQITNAVAVSGKTVVFFSLEMKAKSSSSDSRSFAGEGRLLENTPKLAQNSLQNSTL
jgi:replicative DNA helicase